MQQRDTQSLLQNSSTQQGEDTHRIRMNVRDRQGQPRAVELEIDMLRGFIRMEGCPGQVRVFGEHMDDLQELDRRLHQNGRGAPERYGHMLGSYARELMRECPVAHR